ncbi:unnamed protein product [Arctia plantaginis]|uniref:Lactate/malate dehydrogenase N-terminal domain-containing protein n=1 Tax=Arctia plantaginis TaxID=874455 RepID=A0A8S1BGG4_ARCPL|nr:unnamed protein product [Arctia plantaginis]
MSKSESNHTNHTNGISTQGGIATLDRLFHRIQDRTLDCNNKVSVVGVGQVGMATVFSLLTQGVTTNIAMVDTMSDKLKGEMMDLQHGSAFMKNAKIQASTGNNLLQHQN